MRWINIELEVEPDPSLTERIEGMAKAKEEVLIEADENGNTIIIGGVTLVRPSGGTAIADPIVMYTKCSDAHVQEMWHFLTEDGAIADAFALCKKTVAARLVAFGDKRAGLSVEEE